jgi:hypothetical protein
MLIRRISWDKTCPECKSSDVYRVKSAGLALRMFCKVSNFRARWCAHCDTFFLSPKQSRSSGIAVPAKQGSPDTSASSQTRAGGSAH